MELLIRLWNGLTTNLDLVVAVLTFWMVVELSRRWTLRQPDGPGPLGGLGTWVMVGAIIGGRAGAAVSDLNLYATYPLDLVRINQGLSFYGALVAGALALALYAWRHNCTLLSLCDAFALFLPLGIALYRLGCLAYGFCGGKAAAFPLGIPLPGHVGTRYPSELIEGVLLAGVFFVLFRLARRSPWTGILTGTFLVGYPLLRAGVDLTRFPTGPWPWADPLISLGAAAIGLALLLVLWLRRRSEQPLATKRTAAAGPVSQD